MKTIQIRLKRIITSVHSAGRSMTKRVKIWNTPRLAASRHQHGAGQRQWPAPVLTALEAFRKACFMRASLGGSWSN